MLESFVTNSYYVNDYMGDKLSSAVADKYFKRATIKINDLTLDKARLIQESVKNSENVNADIEFKWSLLQECCCELAEFLYSYESSNIEGLGKKSESVDGWSITYSNDTEQRDYFNNEIRNIIQEYLGNTDLLCRW